MYLQPSFARDEADDSPVLAAMPIIGTRAVESSPQSLLPPTAQWP
jgi:hypothetical protein